MDESKVENIRMMKNKKKKRKTENTPAIFANADPSLQYFKDPTNTPIIQSARKFFASTRFNLDIPYQVHLGPTEGWRSVAKLAVRGSSRVEDNNRIVTNKSIGLFGANSHIIIPCLNSPVHHPAINIVGKIVEEGCVVNKITGYREATDSGLIRYLLLSVELSSNKVQVTFVVNQMPADGIPGCLQQLIDWLSTGKKRSRQIHSIWVHFHPTSVQMHSGIAGKHNNSITSRIDDSWLHVHGERMLRLQMNLQGHGEMAMDGSIVDVNTETNIVDSGENIGKKRKRKMCSDADEDSHKAVIPKLCFPPNVFRQSNFDGFSRIVSSLRKYIPKKSKVIELYGGVGTIGLQLTDLVKRLECSDENPYNVDCFERTLSDFIAERGEEKYRRRIKYIHSSAADRVVAPEGFEGFDLLLVDPPRKGLDEEVITALCQAPTTMKRLVYVSCGFKAFMSNCDQLLLSGWSLIHAEGHVLFPGSDHIETLAIFDRAVDRT